MFSELIRKLRDRAVDEDYDSSVEIEKKDGNKTTKTKLSGPLANVITRGLQGKGNMMPFKDMSNIVDALYPEAGGKRISDVDMQFASESNRNLDREILSELGAEGLADWQGEGGSQYGGGALLQGGENNILAQLTQLLGGAGAPELLDLNKTPDQSIEDMQMEDEVRKWQEEERLKEILSRGSYDHSRDF
tara:strand:- start:2603 stop:3172 length:570 start_codon:yes stop_codon:yes gene_type:complete